MGLSIYNWQLALIYLSVPTLIASLLFLTVKEPLRLAPNQSAVQIPTDVGLGRKMITFMGFDAAKAIHAGGRVYYPMFGALALSAIESFGIMFWRTPYLAVWVGCQPDQNLIGSVALVASRRACSLAECCGMACEATSRRERPRGIRLLLDRQPLLSPRCSSPIPIGAVRSAAARLRDRRGCAAECRFSVSRRTICAGR
jgi:hypothetical protein